MALKIPVENTPPTADPNGPYIVDEKTPVIFDGSGSSDPDAGDSIVSYEWDLNGDGIFETTGVSPSYTWCDDYTGTVTLKVTDTRGASSTASTTVTVNNVAPTVTMASLDQPNPQFILPGQLLTFHGSFIDPGCDTWTYAWSFGDGTSSVAGSLTVILPLTVSHSYTVPGEYPVVLKVTDDNGGSGSSTLTVHVADVVEAKHDLNNYIQNLPDSAFKGNPAQRKNALDNMFRALDTKLENKAYQGFIQDITNNIRGKADGLVDGKSGDDWITDKVAQQHICQKIDDIVKYVKTIK
jgi:PKD repeat protein